MHTLRYDAGAGAYDRLTGRWSRMYVDHVLDAAGVRSGNQVLDVATGTGDAAIAAADRVGSAGRVVAVDISAPMLREAEAKAGMRAIEFAVADAQRLPYADGSFDAIVCLFGVMFVPDKIAMLAGFRRALRPGGRVVATSWATPTQAPFAGLVAEALAEQLPEDRADLLRPFSLADPDANAALYRAAGFVDVNVSLQTRHSPFTSFDRDFWEPIEAGGGRLGQAYLGLPQITRQAVRERVLGQLPVRSVSEPFQLQHSAWVAVATAR
ncbi:MAG: class I SAM-dependent methyltransferase [Burkholderiaceae bacterium]|nr:class I SAM-dependent methyltransferase [Burkholderiaceae bacterium]